jgi:hypothetical protein
MELGRLGLDGPTRRKASGRAAWRPGLRTGAERSTGLGCDGTEDSEDGEQRAAGGPGPKSWIRPVERSAHWLDDGGLCTVARADFRVHMCQADTWEVSLRPNRCKIAQLTLHSCESGLPSSHVSGGHMGSVVTTEPVQDRFFLDRSFQICRLDAQHSNKGIKEQSNGSCKLTLNLNLRVSSIHSSQDLPYSRK